MQPQITRGESETLEFKRSFGAEAIESLCAFANADGGTVLIGVDEPLKLVAEQNIGRFPLAVLGGTD
ncbi:MAG: ATP-binding protein [Candidatus Obscuribacter sp.]|nr:ATP-binding protein [Candidatus Obscuribacter sp.]MBK9281692.1 ATP-binding protein [Candidatus Obscuribacter sp.]